MNVFINKQSIKDRERRLLSTNGSKYLHCDTKAHFEAGENVPTKEE